MCVFWCVCSCVCAFASACVSLSMTFFDTCKYFYSLIRWLLIIMFHYIIHFSHLFRRLSTTNRAHSNAAQKQLDLIGFNVVHNAARSGSLFEKFMVVSNVSVHACMCVRGCIYMYICIYEHKHVHVTTPASMLFITHLARALFSVCGCVF